MNICQVTPRYPPQTGGIETHVKEISERLVTRGHEVTVVTADAAGSGARNETRNGVFIRRSYGLSPGNAFHIAPGIVKAVKSIDADVVHAHNYHSLPMLFAALAVSSERFVVTPHYHGASASGLRDALLSMYHPLGQWAVRRADEVIAVSAWEKNQLQEDFDVGPTVIPNGVTVERFAEAEPENREQPYLLCVGRLEEYKGVQHAVRTLVELPEYDLVVVGSGPYRDHLERVARDEGVAERVEFLGYVDHDRLPRLYAGAEVLMNLSAFEAYGLTVGEALAAGTSSVVNNAGALADWANYAGVESISERVPSRLATAVETVRGQMPDAKNLPTWDDVTEELEVVYRD